MIQEFKKFALKGNMIDMAVGIIIGAAFATVIKSLVDDILMPIIAAIIQKPDFSNLFVMLRNPAGETFASVEAARNAGAAVLGYGLFINALIAFLIVAFVLFVIVKNMNKLMEKKAEEAAKPAAPPQPSAQEVLLSEIRDILKSQKSTS
jgi:large conductance mechanosensitive channel